MTKVFIDGKAGTTGLKIFDRLSKRADLELLTLPEELRKDPAARKEMLNTADIAFLCLPDAAAREAVSLIENPDTVVIDTSTAHRTNPEWAYGFPELSEDFLNKIKTSKRIAVPGCHASKIASDNSSNSLKHIALPASTTDTMVFPVFFNSLRYLKHSHKVSESKLF